MGNFEIAGEEAKLSVACIQNTAVPNAAAAEAPLTLAQKIVTQHRAAQEKEQKAATKTKASK